MKKFKLILLSLCALGLGVAAAPSVLASCSVDVNQMQAQINQYGSISNKGCPLNVYGWGITRVKTTSAAGNICKATCYYASGPGSQGESCNWQTGNWGDTLGCS